MQLSGHCKVTAAAVKEFLAEFQRGKPGFARRQLHRVEPTGQGAIERGLDSFAHMRDIIDVLNTGHWSNFGQKGHFMRRFDGQSPQQAYVEACKYIRGHALTFAKAAVGGSGSSYLLNLGHACHAVEDSFTPSHAVRDPAAGPMRPGPIVYVKMYAGKDAEDHSEGDAKWWDPDKKDFSLQGRLAKNGVKALLHLVFNAVCDARQGNKKSIASLTQWPKYQDTWLKASPKLNKARDQAYDLIDQHYNGFIWGNTNHALNFDEKGLANAIYNRLGTQTTKVHDVFHRLNEYHTADADDVAFYYVTKLQNEKTPRISQAVGKDKKLVDLLIKVMDEGWTTTEEYACIDFLKKIRS